MHTEFVSGRDRHPPAHAFLVQYAKDRAEGEAKGRAAGAVEEARNTLLRLGHKKLGAPDERVLALLAGLGDLDRLNLLLDALLEAACWEDLLSLIPS